MELLKTLLDYFLHLDKYLNSWATSMGGWLYAVLFAGLFA